MIERAMKFHRLFLCRLCRRIIAGCWCEDYVEELIDSCAVCTSEGRKK